jgi:hypothetical protein
VRERPTDAVMNWRSRQSQANSSPSTGTNKNLTAAEEGWRATIAMGRSGYAEACRYADGRRN